MKKKPTKETKRIKQNLKYPFTKDEIREHGISLADATAAIAQIEKDFDNIKAEWKARGTAVTAQIASLTNKVRDGFEYRDIECEETYNDPVNGQKTIRRLDTFETVKIVEMTESDCQRVLDLEEANQ